MHNFLNFNTDVSSNSFICMHLNLFQCFSNIVNTCGTKKNTPTGLFRVIHTLDNVYERDTVNCNIMHQLFIIVGEIFR